MLNNPMFAKHKDLILEVFKTKHPTDFEPDDIDFYSWPCVSGGTSPFGACGQTISKHQVFAFVNPLWMDCVLLIGGRLLYRQNFSILMDYQKI